jgi:hypothetical protein
LSVAIGGLLSGCFSASARWGGNEPSPGVKVAAATADVLSAPVQLPAFAIAKIGEPHRDPKVVAEQAAAERKRSQEREAAAHVILSALKQTPALLTDAAFWDSQPDHDHIRTLGLDWYLQEPTAPASPAINAWLLKRFPEEDGMILHNGRASHDELTGLATDTNQSYRIRETALDCLLRDPTFDFSEPWKRMVFDEFQGQIPLVFGTRRFTRKELIALSQDPKIPKWIQEMAAQNLSWNSFKPETPLPQSNKVPPSP